MIVFEERYCHGFIFIRQANSIDLLMKMCPCFLLLCSDGASACQRQQNTLHRNKVIKLICEYMMIAWQEGLMSGHGRMHPAIDDERCSPCGHKLLLNQDNVPSPLFSTSLNHVPNAALSFPLITHNQNDFSVSLTILVSPASSPLSLRLNQLLAASDGEIKKESVAIRCGN